MELKHKFILVQNIFNPCIIGVFSIIPSSQELFKDIHSIHAFLTFYANLLKYPCLILRVPPLNNWSQERKAESEEHKIHSIHFQMVR